MVDIPILRAPGYRKFRRLIAKNLPARATRAIRPVRRRIPYCSCRISPCMDLPSRSGENLPAPAIQTIGIRPFSTVPDLYGISYRREAADSYLRLPSGRCSERENTVCRRSSAFPAASRRRHPHCARHKRHVIRALSSRGHMRMFARHTGYWRPAAISIIGRSIPHRSGAYQSMSAIRIISAAKVYRV